MAVCVSSLRIVEKKTEPNTKLAFKLCQERLQVFEYSTLYFKSF
jgi:hypothetical protein